MWSIKKHGTRYVMLPTLIVFVLETGLSVFEFFGLITHNEFDVALANGG
jgi:hypothetical protein